eukprot:scaffold870_cov268-Pinguiococcus_pyrenoidosus.AAC.62
MQHVEALARPPQEESHQVRHFSARRALLVQRVLDFCLRKVQEVLQDQAPHGSFLSIRAHDVDLSANIAIFQQRLQLLGAAPPLRQVVRSQTPIDVVDARPHPSAGPAGKRPAHARPRRSPAGPYPSRSRFWREPCFLRDR